MFMTECRRNLNMSVYDLHKLTKVPVYRLQRLEQGVESLYNIPCRDAAEISAALEIAPDVWYDFVYSQEYRKWLKGRSVAYGI